ASGGGTNMQAVIDACKEKRIDAKVVLVISNNSTAYALKRAETEGIDHYHISEYTHREGTAAKLMELLEKYDAELILLAGYMKMLPKEILNKYPVLNIHPALLPKFGGKGMYGERVHQAVLDAHEEESGCTVHMVDEMYDHGKILKQRTVPILEGDTKETLAARVLIEEHKIYVDTIDDIIKGKIDLGRNTNV
ncbi:MAG: phosphoribosylglycinamide formyltransferase, partial [Clostridia bacterium]